MPENDEDPFVLNVTIFSKDFYSGKRAIRLDFGEERKEIVVSDKCPSFYLQEYKDKIEKLKGARTPRAVLNKKFPRVVNGKLVPLESYDKVEREKQIKIFESGNLFIKKDDEDCIYLVRPNTKDWWQVEDASSDFTCLALSILNDAI